MSVSKIQRASFDCTSFRPACWIIHSSEDNISNRLPILTYHSLDDSGSVISLAPSQFRRQMELLRAGGWHTLRLNELLAGHARGEWPARSLALTFDDGFQNFAEHALPVLTECGFTATVFVVAGWVGRTNDWPGQPSWAPRLPLLDWASLRDVAEGGIEIGAHSLSHPHLTRLPAGDAEREISGCKHVTAYQLGRAVEMFAYPYGDRSRELQGIVAKHYRAGLSTRLAFTTAASPLSALDRIDVYRLRDERCFQALEAGWLAAYLRVRRWLADLRVKSAALMARAHTPTPHLKSASETRR